MPASDSGIGNNGVHGMPTSGSCIGNNDANGMPTSDTGIGGNNVHTQYFHITDIQHVERAATADCAGRVERQRVLAEHALSQQQTRAQENIDIARIQAERLLRQQEQAHIENNKCT